MAQPAKETHVINADADLSLRAACVMMQRNEDRCLTPWLEWHGHLFGVDNLYVLDHGSDDPGVLNTLSRFEALGAHVSRLPASADYRKKGELISFAMAQVDALALHDFMFPLDCDEFIVIRDAEKNLSCDRQDILNYLAALPAGPGPLLVKENLVNVLGHQNHFWPEPYQKVFFTGGNPGIIDHGSHHCTSKTNAPIPTQIVYVHLHHKSHETQVRMSREKLKPYVDVDDRAALEAFRGTGWHLVPNLLRSKSEYLEMMTGGSVEFPEFAALLRQRGIDPAFCEA